MPKRHMALTADVVAQAARVVEDAGPSPGAVYLTDAEYDIIVHDMLAQAPPGDLWLFGYGDRREVGGVALMEYDGPGVSATGDQEWDGYCAWWRSRGRWVAVDVLEIDRPGNLDDLADLGLPLPDGKQLLSQVQQAVVAAQCRDHAGRHAGPAVPHAGGLVASSSWRRVGLPERHELAMRWP
jgi:hypothetical protein